MNINDCISIIKNCTTLACEYHIKDKCNYSYEVRENRFECAKEQAIKALEEMQKIRELGDCYIIPKNGVWEVNGIDIHKAIKKQIPVKIKGTHIPICGKCDGVMDLAQGNLNYCPNCGQKLEF